MAEPLRIPYGDGEWQFGELWKPLRRADRPTQVVVLVHGGFWRKIYGLDLMDPLAADLVGRGGPSGTSSIAASDTTAEAGRGR